MKIHKNAILLFTVLAFWIVACSDSTNVVATVNGTKITRKTYESTLDNLILQQTQSNPAFVDNEQTRLLLGKIALDQIITNEVLAQEARKANITVKNEAGALAATLNIIGAHGINMKSLKSRPLKSLPWNYYFYMEAEGNIHSRNGQAMMQELSALCDKLKLVGYYRV